MAKPKFTTATLKLDQLIENPRNPRNHPEEQLAMLRASIRKFGQPRPVLVRAANHMLIAGHGLWRAMQAEGKGQIDAILWDVDQKTADGYMVADNRLSHGAVDDLDRIAEILREQGEDDLAALGYDDEALADLMGKADEAIQVEEVETSTLKASFWITVRGPLSEQAKALKRLKAAMADLGEVSVDLGTAVES